MFLGANWLDWVSLLLGVLGFIIAIVQIKAAKDEASQAKTEAEAAAAAIKVATKQLSINKLLVLMPQFQHLEAEFDVAYDRSDRLALSQSLVTFGNMATHIAELLPTIEGFDADNDEMPKRLKKAAETSRSCKAKLYSDQTKPVRKTVAPIQTEIASLAQGMGGYIARLQSRVEER